MEMNKDETIGFHKGSLTTLLKERQELARMIQIVDQLITAHAKSLEQMGVKLDKAPAKKENMDEKLEDILDSS
ncbi:MAG: hypothetical protein GOU98_00055 [Candidatus Altiarchaeota archaeon]|nr:hypothetical protein [Candidatus Altiarchaeota archaeon]